MVLRSRAFEESKLEGFKYFQLLEQFLPRLRDVGAERDKSGNRELFCDQYRSLLIVLWTGLKPNKRTWEMIPHYFSGWASPAELEAHVRRQLDKRTRLQNKQRSLRNQARCARSTAPAEGPRRTGAVANTAGSPATIYSRLATLQGSISLNRWR